MTPKPGVGHIRLKGIACKSATFEQASIDALARRASLPPDLEYKFTVGSRSSEKDGRVRVELRFMAESDKDAGQPYDVAVTYVGEFEMRDLPEGLSAKNFSEQNATAILFPYLREAVSSLTTRGSMGPLFVPPMNIVALLADARKKADEAAREREQATPEEAPA